jgi:hypothetical protein
VRPLSVALSKLDFSRLPLCPDDPFVEWAIAQGMQELGEAAVRGNIVELDLSGCPIGARGAEIIANFLRSNDTVVYVLL